MRAQALMHVATVRWALAELRMLIEDTFNENATLPSGASRVSRRCLPLSPTSYPRGLWMPRGKAAIARDWRARCD